MWIYVYKYISISGGVIQMVLVIDVCYQFKNQLFKKYFLLLEFYL